MGRVIGSTHSVVAASVKAEGGAAVGGAETVADPASVDTKVRRRDIIQRQRVLVSWSAGRPDLGRWRQ